MMIDHYSYLAFRSEIAILNVRELSLVDGGVNWFAVGHVIGTASRLGGIAGGMGVLSAVAVVGGALAIDYTLDRKLNLIN